MIELPFVTTGAAPAASPLARVAGIRDLSQLGKLELRGAACDQLPEGADAIRLGPRRTLLLCEPGARAAIGGALPGFVIDVTAAYAGIEIDGEQLMRRLSDLDLDALPVAGKVAGVHALVARDGDRFRIWFAQELAESVAEVVLDAMAAFA